MPALSVSNSPAIWFENHLKQQADTALDRRQAAYEKVKSQADCRAWQAERRVFFLRQIGGLPERTPLNARVVGTLDGKGYRIEKILFESRPGFHLTAYLMALDDRIVAAAPGCYLTTFRRLIATRGAQDAEQNLFGQLAFGLEESDYLMMRAPRPTLICAATRDVTFDIGGTWELFRESKRFYSRLGHAERVELVEADAPHGFSILLREAAARWMHRWLLGSDKVIREVEHLPDPLTDEQARALSAGDWTAQQLQCTPQGQVLLMNGEQSVFQINAKAAGELKPKRTAAWNRLSPEAQRQLVRETIGARLPETKPARAVEITGRLERDGYAIHKLVLTAEPGLRLPALAFVPTRPNGVATLYLHGVSMTNDATPGGTIEALVKQGRVVLAAELRGIGETETGHQKRDYGYGRFGRDVHEIFLAYLLGKSFVGMRVEDVFSWTQALREFAPAGAPPRSPPTPSAPSNYAA